MKQERDIGTPAAVRNELPKSYHNVFDVTFMFHSSFMFLLMLHFLYRPYHGFFHLPVFARLSFIHLAVMAMHLLH